MLRLVQRLALLSFAIVLVLITTPISAQPRRLYEDGLPYGEDGEGFYDYEMPRRDEYYPRLVDGT